MYPAIKTKQNKKHGFSYEKKTCIQLSKQIETKQETWIQLSKPNKKTWLQLSKPNKKNMDPTIKSKQKTLFQLSKQNKRCGARLRVPTLMKTKQKKHGPFI